MTHLSRSFQESSNMPPLLVLAHPTLPVSSIQESFPVTPSLHQIVSLQIAFFRREPSQRCTIETVVEPCIRVPVAASDLFSSPSWPQRRSHCVVQMRRYRLNVTSQWVCTTLKGYREGRNERTNNFKKLITRRHQSRESARTTGINRVARVLASDCLCRQLKTF